MFAMGYSFKIRQDSINVFVHAGQYLYEAIKSSPAVNVVVDFVWNRSLDKIKHLPKEEILENLDDFDKRYVVLSIQNLGDRKCNQAVDRTWQFPYQRKYTFHVNFINNFLFLIAFFSIDEKITYTENF